MQEEGGHEKNPLASYNIPVSTPKLKFYDKPPFPEA